MAKVWCAEIMCKHNENNLCRAKKINLTAGHIHTLYDGCAHVWTCRSYEMSADVREIAAKMEEFYARHALSCGIGKGAED